MEMLKTLPNISDLLKILNNTNIKTQFYTDCIQYLKGHENTSNIYEIPNNKYLLEPLRLYLTSLEKSNLKLYLSDELPLINKNNYCYRSLNLSIKAQNCLLRQINTSLIQFCNNPNSTIINYFIISNQDINMGEQIHFSFEILSLLLGVKSLEILEYQNVNNLCSYLKNESILTNFYNFYNKLSIVEKENILVLNSLTPLGTVFDNNINLMYVINDKDNISQKIKNNNYNCHYIYKDKPHEIHNLEMIVDPDHHFHFMGIKFISIEQIVQRNKKQASALSYINLLLLEKYNNYNTKICFPNLSIRKGIVSIFNDKLIDTKIKKIKRLLQEWYDIDMTYEELQNKIFKCRDKPFEIYESRPIRNRYTNEVIRYHTEVMNYYINNYFDKEKLLDIGAGPLRQIELFEKYGFKHYVALEPSKESIKTGIERHKSKCKSIKLDSIEGVGNEEWDNKYKQITNNKPYKSILFKFTIHYMIRNIDILLNNLKNVIDKNCTIIISCIDGTKLMQNMKDKNKYEIMLGDEPIYGVYDFPSKDPLDNTENYKQIMIYFKGVYGVESGSIEYIVNINYLISQFKKIGFEPILSKNFMEITVPKLVNLRKNFNHAQKKIAELHHIIILKNSNLVGGTDFEYKYNKYKTKYLNSIGHST